MRRGNKTMEEAIGIFEPAKSGTEEHDTTTSLGTSRLSEYYFCTVLLVM